MAEIALKHTPDQMHEYDLRGFIEWGTGILYGTITDCLTGEVVAWPEDVIVHMECCIIHGDPGQTIFVSKRKQEPLAGRTNAAPRAFKSLIWSNGITTR